MDIHIHGAAGSDVMDGTVSSIETIANALLEEVVTGFLCTTMTQSAVAIEKAITKFKSKAALIKNVLGIHLEGPFVNEARAGAQPIVDASFNIHYTIINGQVVYSKR